MSEPLAGDKVEVRDGKLYSEGAEVTVEEALALGWEGPQRGDTTMNMAERLRSVAGILAFGATDEATVKLIFDLKGAASHLDDLDRLLDLLTDGELEKFIVTNPRMEELKEVAAEIRERKAKGSDPEPKIA